MGPFTGRNREAVFQFIKKLPHCTKILYLLLLLPWAHISLSLTGGGGRERQTKPSTTLLPYVQCTKWTAHVVTAASPSPRQTCLTSSSDIISKYFDSSGLFLVHTVWLSNNFLLHSALLMLHLTVCHTG